MRTVPFIALLIVAAFFTLAMVPLQVQADDADYTTDGLVLYWNMTGTDGSTVTDLSGNNHTGNVTGATHYILPDGGNAYWFDGVNDYINTSNLPGENFSVETWFSANNTGYVFSQTLIGGGSNYYGYYQQATTGLGFRTNVFNITGLNPGAIASYGTFSANTMYHLVVTYDNSTQNLTLYTNGVLRQNKAVTGGYRQDTTHRFTIGKNSAESGSYLNGTVSMVRVYDRKLTDAEVLTNYQSTGTTPTPTPTPTINPEDVFYGVPVNGEPPLTVQFYCNITGGI